MGKLPTCPLCRDPVLELEGQFELLQPYFTDVEHPALEIAGTCHSSCLVESPHAATWQSWRLAHFTSGRGYSEIGVFDGWHVLRSQGPGRLLAFHTTGCSVRFELAELRKSKACAGGVLLPVQQEMHIGSDDVAAIAAMQQALEVRGSISIHGALTHLRIAKHVRWPQGLERALFVDAKRLRRDWGVRDVAAIAHYAHYLPSALRDGAFMSGYFVWNSSVESESRAIRAFVTLG